MSKYKKLFQQVTGGASDANIAFDDLCQLLRRLGFEERISSRHHVFRKEDIIERVNLQRDGNKAKSYQVRQVRDVLVTYELGGDIE